jgi:hypothetical protein
MVDVLLLDEGEEEPPAAAHLPDARRVRPRAGTVAFVVTMLVIAGVVVTQLRTSPDPDTTPPVTAPTAAPPVDVVPVLPPVDPSDLRMLVVPGPVDGELSRWVRNGPDDQWGESGGLPVPGVAYVVRVACLSPSGQSLTYGVSPDGGEPFTSGTVPCGGQEVVSAVGEVPPVVTPLIVTFGADPRVDDIGSAYAIVVPAG